MTQWFIGIPSSLLTLQVLIFIYNCLLFTVGASQVAHWDMTGSAVVLDNRVQLTADQGSLSGAIWNQKVDTVNYLLLNSLRKIQCQVGKFLLAL